MDLRSEQIPSKDGKYNGQKYWSNANYKHDLKLDDNGMHNASDNHAGNMTTFISVPSSSAQQNYSGRPHKQETIRDSQKNRLHTYNSSNRRQNSSFENCYDVYNNSSTAFEFIDNLGRYLSSRIPPCIFNLQDCPSNPMIPTYLIVMGCLFIIWAVVRGFACCSSARENTSLGADLLCKLIEGFLLVSFIAWLLIGTYA
ncbi:unnamed protein product [Thelazia callipaeda]|uniref:MARVEL domain-containing protein n=1 Tax=Thelazia callipaeda TaxID=103827 RepID=A0A0N5CLK5_THECL|nr:unnamed protein product [Thelazia callipaeda]